MSNRASVRLRFVLRTAGLPAIALFGAAAAMCIPTARADLVPTLPTVTVPSLPVSVPTVTTLPIGTTATVTTPPTTSTAGGGGGGAGAGGGSDPPISIPVSSVTAPAHLAIDRITISPKWIGVRRQQVRLVVRVIDSRGYRVRGASVSVRSNPARMTVSVGVRKTRADGTVGLQFRTTSLVPMRAGAKLVLVVRAYHAGAPLTGTNVARRVVSLPIRPR